MSQEESGKYYLKYYLRGEYFQGIENPNKAPVLAAWERRLRENIIFIPEEQAAVRPQSDPVPSDSTFTFSLQADSSSATLSPDGAAAAAAVNARTPDCP